jgi:hypothetical protein
MVHRIGRLPGEEETGKINVTSGGAACPPGQILRRASRRSKATCVKDIGARGRWQTVRRSIGIGPLKKGELTSLGYSHTLPAAQRHEAIDKAVSKYGRNSTIRKLNAIATYTKRTAPSRSKTYKTDLHYVQKKY